MGRNHNKRRNTGFVYEAIVKEVTRCVLEKDTKSQNVALSILKEHFSPNTVLGKELDCYRSLSETNNLDRYTAEKMIFKTREKFNSIDKQQVFLEQNAVISKVNRRLEPRVFDNFVPNYKTLATIYNIFNDKVSVKKKVLYENNMLEALTKENTPEKEPENQVNELVYSQFVKRFNKTYGNLNEEQKKLIQICVLSKEENSSESLLYLNEELNRLKEEIIKSLDFEEVFADQEMVKNTKKVLEILENIKEQRTLDDSLLVKILKIQNLVREYKADDNKSNV
tara:strand:+ start:1209 stop:2051 length:843 start_codon:yes stop_codon:yes gene_type:complete